MQIMRNSRNNEVVLHFGANSATSWNNIIVAGNNTVSNIALPGEVLSGGYIESVWCGSASGNGSNWIVRRGANLASSNVVLTVDSTAMLDFGGFGVPLTLHQTQPLHVQLVGTNPGSLIIQIKKVDVNGRSGPMGDANGEYLVG